MDDTRNLIAAVAVSIAILLAWNYFVEKPQFEARQREIAQQAPVMPVAVKPAAPAPAVALSLEKAKAASPRIKISSPSLHGTLALKGARLDDLTLAGYRETTALDAPEVVLFSPAGTEKVYFAEFGWLGDGAPDENTVWKADANELTPEKPVTLSWVNPHGVKFSIRIALDDHYLFTLTRKVENASKQPVTLSEYGLLSRARAEAKHFFILHEGPLGVLDGTLNEAPFYKLKEQKKHPMSGEGWLGIADKYWLAAMIPQKGESVDGNATYYSDNGDRYQVDYRAQAETIVPGNKREEVTHLFAGAKKISLLDYYEDKLGLTLFDRAIDFGWFYFLTKPMLYAVTWLYSHIGNFGLALMALTVLIKLLMFPLANKSYRAMSQMKRLHPKIVEMREKYGDDKVKMNQAVMEFYKKERVNPVSGCLPVIVQIPIFFSLYKVLFVTIEMRQAPFYGWIHDLSAPDPTNIFTLFGMLPYVPPTFLHLGLWPLIMGITMIIQQKLNPPPSDPAQAKVIAMMPYFFVFMFASFPAGLVIYWSWSNTLSILQQKVMMRIVDKEAEKKAHHKHANNNHADKKKK